MFDIVAGLFIKVDSTMTASVEKDEWFELREISREINKQEWHTSFLPSVSSLIFNVSVM